jgi:hypothetical protein
MIFSHRKNFLHRFAIVALGAVAWVSSTTHAAPFTPGNVVVYRLGDGSGALTSAATPVFLDEYSVSGTSATLVQSVALPTTSVGTNRRIAASGTATSDGMLTRSADGRYLLATGYDAAVAAASVVGASSTAVPRVVGRIYADATIDSSTALTDAASGVNFRGAASLDGSGFWVVGGTGTAVRYATPGATASTQLFSPPTVFRSVNIFGGQLYVSTSTGTVRLGTVGSGTPTTAGQPLATLPGIATLAGAYTQFFFSDLDTGVPGVDTLYIADETASTGVITKYSLVSGTWMSNGTVSVGTGNSFIGLTGKTVGSSVTLFATRTTSAPGSELMSIVDANGYNAAFSASSSVVATAATNTALRGVAMAPQVVLTVTPSAGANGSISPNTAQTAFLGTTLSFTVTPNAGFSAVVVGSCGGALTGNTYTTNTLSSDCTVSANFVATPTYNVTPSVVGSGTISPNAPVSVLSGATTQFTVTPSPGFSTSVGGTCGGNLVGTIYTTNTVSADCTVEATFTQITYTVTPSAGANGSITPSAPQTVNSGSTQAFTVTPDSGFTASVGGSCGGSLVGSTFTTSPVTANCTVDASFAPLPTYTVTLTSTANGTVSPATSQTVTQGNSATFTATPATGYSVIMSGCGGKMNNGIFITAPITANCSIKASFAQKNILFVGNSYTFARVDPAMTYNAANVNDLTADFNAAFPNGSNSWPFVGGVCSGIPSDDGCFEPHPWGGVPGIFKALSSQAGLDFNVSHSTRNASSLRGHFLNTANAVWDLRGNIASQKWDIVSVQGQSDEPLPSNKSKNGDPVRFKTYANQIARYVYQGNGQTTNLVTTEQAIYAAEGFGTSNSTTSRTIPPNFNANPTATVFVMQNWSRPDMVEAHKCTRADFTSLDGAPILDPTCSGNTNGTGGENNVFYTAQSNTALNLNDITNDMNSSLSSLISASALFSGVIPTGNAFQKAVNAGVVKNSAFYNAAGVYDESGGLMNLWWLDRTHGSKHGSYLSALVHFARITGQDPTQFGSADAVAASLTISSAEATTLQQMAKAAVVPAAPSGVSAVSGNGTATVSFTPPISLGGLAISGYTVTCGSQSAAGTASPIIVSGLTNGSAVTCKVVAVNSVGSGEPSSASNTVTPLSPTTTVVSANINPSVVSQTVIFTASVTPGSNNGGSVNFFDGASSLCSNVLLTMLNTAACAASALSAGAHSITASYSGNGGFAGSISAGLAHTVNASSTLALTVTKAGTGAGVVVSSPPGINCGTDCDEPYANPTSVTLTATPDAGFIFTGWLGDCTGRSICQLTMASSASVTATFAPSTIALHLDVDGTNAYSAESDALLIARYLFGVRGNALVVDTLAASSTDPAVVEERLGNLAPIFDVDGDGRVDATTDGLIITRYLLGARGDALISGALSASARRTVALDIEAYLQGITPTLP